MELFLVLLLTKSVLGDKLSPGYLPPPNAHLSAGDLNYSDLPFELPNQSLNADLKTTPEVKEIGNYFMDSRGSEAPVSYDAYYKPPAITSSSMTTVNPVTEHIANPSTQMTTGTDFTYDTTEYKIPQNINQSQGSDLLFNITDLINSTSVKETLPVIEIEKNYPSLSLISSQEPRRILETEAFHMTFNNPNANSDIFDNQPKYYEYPSVLTDSSMVSDSRIENQNNDSNAINTKQKYNLTSDGFSYSFETSNGMRTAVSGTAIDGVKSAGSFSYIGDDGKIYKMEYTADENGFQPRGAHLPTPPPIPKDIQAVIDQAYRNKAAGIFDDGSYSDDKYGYKNYSPQYRKKVTKQKKSNKITKIKMVQPSNINDDYYSNNVYTSTTNDVRPVNNEIIPVEVIYDNGYSYSQPQKKLLLPGDSGHQAESSESSEPQIDKPQNDIQKINDGSSTHNLQNNDTISITEKPNQFVSTDIIGVREKNQPFSTNKGNSYENKNYKPIFSTTYDMSLNNLNSRGLPTTPLNSLKNTNTQAPGTSKHEDVDMLSTFYSERLTTASPSTVSMPIYVQTQVSEEYFSGPKQLPTFDPKSGYFY